MNKSIFHRGPDAGSYYLKDNKLALGHRRLSIIDKRVISNLPISTNSGRWDVVFNGETYNIGGRNEMTNLNIVDHICTILDGRKPKNSGSYKDQIVFVVDRAGHDRRYAIDATKIEDELGWKADEDFKSGIIKTVDWYLNNLKK